MFFAGFFTVAQFSFWGNYLPRMFPTHLRGTGEAFAANVGGRMIGTSFAYVTATLASSLSGPPHVQLAAAAAVVAVDRLCLWTGHEPRAARTEGDSAAGIAATGLFSCWL